MRRKIPSEESFLQFWESNNLPLFVLVEFNKKQQVVFYTTTMPCMQPIKLTAAKGLYQLATAGFSESLLLILGSLAQIGTVDVVTRGETGKTKTKKSTQSLPMSSGLQTYPRPPQIPPEASGKNKQIRW